MAASNGKKKAPVKARGKLRQIVTPEGVPLTVTLSGRGERATAFMLDLFFIFLGLLALGFLTLLLVRTVGLDVSFIVVMLAWFVLRSFYFALFELYWHGQTPGKKVMKLKVIRRSGGRLDAGAIFSRNLMREVEFFLPLTVLLYGNSIGADWVIVLLSLAWMFIMVFMPFFNRDNMRVGDIVGGTWVIASPKTVLLPEVGHHVAPAADKPRLYFSKKQLGIYGIYELETLENVLRREDAEAARLHREIVERIKVKIGWSGGGEYIPDKDFLDAFYSALRRHLESGMLLGRRKENKYDGLPELKNPLKEPENATEPGTKKYSPPDPGTRQLPEDVDVRPIANPLKQQAEKAAESKPLKNPLYRGPDKK